MDIQEVNNRLASLTREIQAIYQIINESEPQLPAEAQEKFDNDICLECGKKFTQQQIKKRKRGLHESCYRKVTRAIASGKSTEYEAISKGFLAPKSTGGRPPELTSLEKKLNEEKKGSASQKPPSGTNQD